MHHRFGFGLVASCEFYLIGLDGRQAPQATRQMMAPIRLGFIFDGIGRTAVVRDLPHGRRGATALSVRE
jgi:hypothetical protein